jgi:hypothetical protein
MRCHLVSLITPPYLVVVVNFSRPTNVLNNATVAIDVLRPLTVWQTI